jgi:hypothetical protein
MKTVTPPSSSVAGLLQKACAIIDEREIPVITIVLHTPLDASTFNNVVITPSKSSFSAHCPVFAAPAISYVATKKQQKQLDLGTCAPHSDLFPPSNIPALSKFLRASLRTKWKAFGDVLAPARCERDTWDQSEYEARIRKLEAELRNKDRLLAASRSLNAEFADTVERYKQRYQDAVKVLDPPKATSTAAQDMQVLEQERLRLQAGSALPHDPVQTQLWERLSLVNQLQPTEKVWTRQRLEGYIQERKGFAERTHAATLIQSAWLAAWACELLRRDKDERSARIIQKRFRLYRWRKMAWMY